MKRKIGYLLWVMSAACGASSAVPAATHPQPRSAPLPVKKNLPLAARDALTMRMERHEDQMLNLVASVVMLNYREAKQLAHDIAQEPKLGRPRPGEKDTLNALLPESFFFYQDQLAERARVVELAAEEKSDANLGRALGMLTETCVGCHSTYLPEEYRWPKEPKPAAPEDEDENGNEDDVEL